MSVDPLLLGIPGSLAVLSGAVAYAGTYPRSQLFGRTVWRTCATEKLAITFDDGPNPAITPRLLDLLEAHGARATFFLIGRFAAECPELVREIVSRGHIVGNHTQTHPNLFWCSPERVRSELQRCQDAVSKETGAPPMWFRPPYGSRNPWVVSQARSLGMKTVMWTLIPGDWLVKPADWLAKRMEPVAAKFERTKHSPGDRSGHRRGDILCLHDGSHRALNADRTHTLAALEYWLPRWRDLGLQFVTIAEAVS